MAKGASRFVCIHGHFYQPPRENPWLETIEHQESAYPYPNWNERILAECYRPNAAARTVDGEGRIVLIGNNYASISFNIGPTLLAWLEDAAPDVYQAIIEADQLSKHRFGGHGSAIAQAYNHMIMPLASPRDKRTQVIWGIRDFEYHFGRKPEGMWLPETAVDSETLDIMAEHGIAFTILAPGQARRIRPLGGEAEDWIDVSGGRIEPGRTYRALLPSGRHIDIFFYDGPTSSAVAFERLLGDGGRFADRLVCRALSNEPLLFHIATDGETYGHHHRHGDMALAYAVYKLEKSRHEQLTNYGEFRELHPARHEVEIYENTAWSCAHGVGRWMADCGCCSGAHADWHQRWRKPLRESLNWLRDELVEVFERHGAEVLADPWAARDAYIDVINDRSAERVDAFLRAHQARELDAAGQQKALQLLEMQRQAMQMFTSCGWFFDDISGTEPLQVLQYAARAIELGQKVTSREDIEPAFLERLAEAQSNLPEAGDGKQIYEQRVLPARVDLRRVIAHHAVSSLFEDASERTRVYCYEVEATHRKAREAGKARLAVGTVRVTSTITRETSTLSYGALHLGDHNITGGVRSFAGEGGQAAYERMVEAVLDAFERADLVATQRQLDHHFQDASFSLASLFRDHQERILERILEIPLADAEAAYNQLYTHHAPLMRYLVSFDLPIPDAFKTAAKFVLHARLRRALEKEQPDPIEVRMALTQARLVGVSLHDTGVDYLWQQSLERLVNRLASQPDDLDALSVVTAIAEVIHAQHFQVELWHTQNECYKLLHSEATLRRRQAYDGNPEAQRWIELFERLCRAVHIAI